MTGPIHPPARLTGLPHPPPTPAEIRAELTRRAAGITPQPAHFIEDFEPPFRDAEDFCESCALAAAGALEVRREYNSDSDVLRWCSACGALLGYRIGPGGAEEEIERWEEKPPRAASDWAEVLHAMAEVPPEDWREAREAWGLEDEPFEPSLLWARVAALLTPRTPCAVPRELRPCERPKGSPKEVPVWLDDEAVVEAAEGEAAEAPRRGRAG